MKCECEHADHFDDGPAHPYGEAKGTAIRMTPLGSFALCDGCLAADHMDQFSISRRVSVVKLDTIRNLDDMERGLAN